MEPRLGLERESRDRLVEALTAPAASARLQAVLRLGTTADPEVLDLLVERLGLEPDFYVRDMLTWALTRFPRAATTPRLIDVLRSPLPQARSQALHTLSKTQDPAAWPFLTPGLLHDSDDEVARSAWRAAVVLVPTALRTELAALLATQFARGDHILQRSLSRAIVALGVEAAQSAIRIGAADPEPRVRAHAEATARLLSDPDSGFAPDLLEAKRTYILARQR